MFSHNLCTFLLVLYPILGQKAEEIPPNLEKEEDYKKHWVDHGDMINYKRHKKDHQIASTLPSNCPTSQELVSCRAKLEEVKENCSNNSTITPRKDIWLVHMVNTLLRK